MFELMRIKKEKQRLVEGLTNQHIFIPDVNFSKKMDVLSQQEKEAFAKAVEDKAYEEWRYFGGLSFIIGNRIALYDRENPQYLTDEEDEKLVDTLFAEARAKQTVSVYSLPVHRCEFERYIYRDGKRFKTNHYKYYNHNIGQLELM